MMIIKPLLLFCVLMLALFHIETNKAFANGSQKSYLGGTYDLSDYWRFRYLNTSNGFYVLRSDVDLVLRQSYREGASRAIIQKDFKGYQLVRDPITNKYSFVDKIKSITLQVKWHPSSSSSTTVPKEEKRSVSPPNLESASSSQQPSRSVEPFIYAEKKSCMNVYNVLDKLKEIEEPTLADQVLREKCLKDRNDRSFDCIHWLTHQAVRAMNTTSHCAGRVTVDKLMCIFKQEQRLMNQFHCNTKGACGLSQITEAGAKTVIRGFNVFGLAPQWDLFWQMINRPEGRYNKCQITNQSARDRDSSIIMAATHYCAQIKSKPSRSDLFTYCEYNAGDKACLIQINDYARRVASCEKTNTWMNEKRELAVELNSSCRKKGNCPEANVIYRFAGTKNNSGFAIK